MSRLRILVTFACAAAVFASVPAQAASSDDSFQSIAARELTSPVVDFSLSHFTGADDDHHRHEGPGHGDDHGRGGVSPVPEPASWAMMAAGIVVIGAVARRRRLR